MKLSLLNMNQLSVDEIMQLIQDAMAFSNEKKDWQFSRSYLVANLFFEASTRTHYSFVAAEHQLNCKVVDVHTESSSITKGESLYDTVKMLACVGYDAVVMRHPQNEYYKALEDIDIHVINGGDGSGEHPSQCLLDLLTIYQEFKKFEGLNVVIIGDIKHSRVANSNYDTLTRLGANVRFSGPQEWISDTSLYVDIDTACEEADVIMMLRIQHERHATSTSLDKGQYLAQYGLTQARAHKMKTNAIIMHPAPVNRGVEIDDCLVECERSRIFKQMENGVYMRKAIFKKVFAEEFYDN